MSVMRRPVAMEKAANAMPASRMLPPTFSVKAEYIGTSIDSAKVVRKLIFRSSRASRETKVSMEGQSHELAPLLYAMRAPGTMLECDAGAALALAGAALARGGR